MAKMIPPFYEDTVVSDGEKKFFRMLKKLDDRFIILHSLGIAQHYEKVFGEIDFVIICNEGILCMEIKGGHVFRENGLWHFTNREGNVTTKAEGPFRQVFTAMMSLRAHIKKNFSASDAITSCQFACGVAFTDMPFTQKGPDIINETIFDNRTVDMEQYIINIFKYWRSELETKHGFIGGKLSNANIERTAKYLRGDFGFVPSVPYILNKTEEKLVKLTNDQINRLSMASENPRILLKGGAGTGKTLLSLEHARRNAITGKKVLFVCFNRYLAKHLELLVKNNYPEIADNICFCRFHSYIIDELKKHGYTVPNEGTDENEFFDNKLPEAFLELASEDSYSREIDLLIIDEGQDLLRFEFVMCFDAILKNGLEKGCWHLCYDQSQNIYNPRFKEGLQAILEYNPVILKLDTNCRNTRPIGIYNTLYTGIEPARFFLVDGEDVKFYEYSDYDDERKIVIEVVKRLIGQGVKPGNIFLLSRYKFLNSCLRGENIFKNVCKFQDATNFDPAYLVDDSIKFCTVQSFKGLEAPVVLLIDVESFIDDISRQLNYIAMSRSMTLLRIFYNKKAKNELKVMEINNALLLQTIEG